MSSVSGFVPPPYPQDQLAGNKQAAMAHTGGVVDLSIGAPFLPPPDTALELLANPLLSQKYPPSVGSADFKQAAASWLGQLCGIEISVDHVAASVGSKEFVASLPGFLKLRQPGKSTILYPQISYPTYAMGAQLGSCKAVAVKTDSQGRMDLSSISDADIDDALCLWINTPNNPTGIVEDLEAAVAWAKEKQVLLISDECYIEFCWDVKAETVLNHASENILAVHSLSKRSNFAGLRSGFYAGDPELVQYLSEVRKHAGLMQPGPVQQAAVAVFADQTHVQAQRQAFGSNLKALIEILHSIGVNAEMPEGGFYLWFEHDGMSDWQLAEFLAQKLGVLCIPGSLYGETDPTHVRIAAVTTSSQLELLRSRVG